MKTIETLHWRAMLSTLWIYYLLNMVFRDVHEFFRSDFLKQVSTGVINGAVVTEEILLAGGLVLQIPLLMVVLSRMLPNRINRWLNGVAGSLALLSVIVSQSNPDMDDLMFASMEALALIAIVHMAWRGPRWANDA